jgi:hypothetical protein
MQKTRTLRMLAIVAGLAAPVVSTPAQSLFNVDAGGSGNPLYSGAAVLGASGDVWNSYVGQAWGPHNAVILQDSTGSSAAGVTVDVWNYYGTYDNTGGITANPMGLMEDYINAYGSGDGFPIRIELANLPTLTAFTLVVYSAGDTAGQGGTISLATDNTFATILQTGTTTAASRDINDGAGVAYQTFSGTTSATGTIDFQIANTADWHSFNGLQLQFTPAPVPEPSTLALAGLGGLMTFGWLRRRIAR